MNRYCEWGAPNLSNQRREDCAKRSGSDDGCHGSKDSEKQLNADELMKGFKLSCSRRPTVRRGARTPIIAVMLVSDWTRATGFAAIAANSALTD